MFKKAKKLCSLIILSFFMIFQTFNLVVNAGREPIPEKTLRQLILQILNNVNIDTSNSNQTIATICEHIAKYHPDGYFRRVHAMGKRMRRYTKFPLLDSLLIEKIKTAQEKQYDEFLALAAINHEQAALTFCDMIETPEAADIILPGIKEWINKHINELKLIDQFIGGKVYKSTPAFTYISSGYRCFAAKEFLEAAILWSKSDCPNTAAQAYYTACNIMNANFIKLDPKKENLFFKKHIISAVKKQKLVTKKDAVKTCAIDIINEARIILDFDIFK